MTSSWLKYLHSVHKNTTRTYIYINTSSFTKRHWWKQGKVRENWSCVILKTSSHTFSFNALAGDIIYGSCVISCSVGHDDVMSAVRIRIAFNNRNCSNQHWNEDIENWLHTCKAMTFDHAPFPQLYCRLAKSTMMSKHEWVTTCQRHMAPFTYMV